MASLPCCDVAWCWLRHMPTVASIHKSQLKNKSATDMMLMVPNIHTVCPVEVTVLCHIVFFGCFHTRGPGTGPSTLDPKRPII